MREEAVPGRRVHGGVVAGPGLAPRRPPAVADTGHQHAQPQHRPRDQHQQRPGEGNGSCTALTRETITIRCIVMRMLEEKVVAMAEVEVEEELAVLILAGVSVVHLCKAGAALNAY